jgi:preprotein translocase subunit YajC
MDFLIMDAAAAAPQQVGLAGGLMQFMPFILIFAVMYFLMIRPQKKKQVEHQKMLDNLQIHDKVITNGGIIGKVVAIKKEKNIVVVRVDDTTNTKIEFQKSAIGGVIQDESARNNTAN